MKTYSEMTGAELLALYNERTGKSVKRFASRADGIRRLEDHDCRLAAAVPATEEQLEDAAVTKVVENRVVKSGLFDFQEEPTVIEAAGTDCSAHSPTEEIMNPPVNNRSAGIARSWTDPEIAAKRSQRHGVEVDGEEFKSVGEAFRVLGLPLEKHIKFRMELKAAGTLVSFGHTWVIFAK